ncbi:putative urea transporter protein [Zalerion maritima]|uniref:Urea transporter protein n=1 Tax=Zalerion maritima TaxID=339359 RepID=A0AAD5S1M2_9PEZI|nr:putative urea transporter protein [Zalerion maritima]
MGSGILFSYPQLATITGVQGVIVYALSSALPLLVFATVGPIIRRKCPQGFVLTEWTRQRYGIVAAIYLSFMTLATLFLYMIAELSAVGQVITALTGMDGLPVIIVEVVVTTIYTSLGGFQISFKTDIVQGTMVTLLIVIATITIGAKSDIQKDLIDSSGLLDASLLGWQLIYILPVAILTNNFFLASYWLRTFASKTDKDLRIGVSIATAVVLCVLVLVGMTGCIATWTGAFPGDPPQEDGSVAFFLLIGQLPAWVVGIVLVMVVSLSTAAFDSWQSAMVSTASNDLFRNRLNIWYIRVAVVLVIIPVVILALKAPSILQIFLISDLISAATIPALMLGLHRAFYFWHGLEVVAGGFGGILTVFLFGLVYYDGDADAAAGLLILENGLYGNDWSAFGAFVAAPVGSLLWGFGVLGVRLGIQWLLAKKSGKAFTSLDRPVEVDEAEPVITGSEQSIDDKAAGKFF